MLNLWQKNGVFKIEIIQPLLDMAAGSSSAVPAADSVANNEGEAGSELWVGGAGLFACGTLRGGTASSHDCS